MDSSVIIRTFKCQQCLVIKEIFEFYKDGTDAYGNQKYRNVCKECEKERRLLNEKLKSHIKSSTQCIVSN